MITAAANWTITLNDTTFSGTDIVNNIIQRNYSKSFVCYEHVGNDYANLYAKWQLYKNAETGRLSALLRTIETEYTPGTDYTRSRTLEENVDNTSNADISRTDSSQGSSSNSVQYGHIITDDVSTYNAANKNVSRETNSGIDSNSGSSSSSLTSTQDIDKTDEIVRDLTETVTGSNSTVDNMAKYADFMAHYDIMDMILTGFEKKFLFYGGDFYDY